MKTLQVAIAVIEREGRYLVSRRRPDAGHLGGYWEFPGGKRRAGESWEACLHRELREELGIAVEPIQRLDPIRFRYPDRAVRLEVFRCAMVSGEPKPLGCQAVRWASLAQLARLRFPPADRPLIRRLSRLSHHLPASRRLAPKGPGLPLAIPRQVVGLRRATRRAIIAL